MLVSTLTTLFLVKSIAAADVAEVQAKRMLRHKGALNFFFFGDWGHGNATSTLSTLGFAGEQEVIAAQVNAYSDIIKPDFFVALGDNFYNIGTSSVTDPQWTTSYTNVYTAQGTYGM